MVILVEIDLNCGKFGLDLFIQTLVSHPLNLLTLLYSHNFTFTGTENVLHLLYYNKNILDVWLCVVNEYDLLLMKSI